MDRIVLDTNCLIQSVSSRSPYRRVWDSLFDGTNLLCVTTSILNEYEEILSLLTNEETAKYIIDAIVSSPYTRFVNVYFDFNLIQADPDDNKFVDCAITAGARYLVMLLQKTIITMSSNGRIFLDSRSLGWMTFYVI